MDGEVSDAVRGAPPHEQPRLPWQLCGSSTTRCTVAALCIAVPFTALAVSAGRGVTYTIAVFLGAAAVGIAIGMVLSSVKRRLLAPGAHGVSRLRLRQLTSAGAVPDDPAERRPIPLPAQRHADGSFSRRCPAEPALRASPRR